MKDLGLPPTDAQRERAIWLELKPPQRRALLACSSVWMGETLGGCPRHWRDICHQKWSRYASIEGLARRGLVKTMTLEGYPGTFVSLTLLGLRVRGFGERESW